MFRPIDIWARATAEGHVFEPMDAAEQTAREKIKQAEELDRQANERLFRSMQFDAMTKGVELFKIGSWVASELAGKGIPSKDTILSCAQKMEDKRLHTGIYFLVDKSKDEITYVGQSVNVFARIAVHVADQKNGRGKEFDAWAYINCPESWLDIVESIYIHILSPKHNTGLAPLRFADIVNMATEKYEEKDIATSRAGKLRNVRAVEIE
jgi:hypothetical protein